MPLIMCPNMGCKGFEIFNVRRILTICEQLSQIHFLSSKWFIVLFFSLKKSKASGSATYRLRWYKLRSGFSIAFWKNRWKCWNIYHTVILVGIFQEIPGNGVTLIGRVTLIDRVPLSKLLWYQSRNIFSLLVHLWELTTDVRACIFICI